MPMKWGIIGMGDIADKVMAPAMTNSDEHELFAVMRRDPILAEELGRKHGASKIYTNLEDLLNDESIDAVYVATPVYLHKEQTIMAANYGKHVLCEKPMAMNASEGRDMVKACYENQVKLMLCYYQRFNRRHQKIKELLETGEIGQVTAVRITNCTYKPAGTDEWRQQPDISGGGNLMDVGSHCVDLLRYLFGEISSVSSLVDTLAFDYPVDDTATMLLELSGSIHAVVSTHWSALIPDTKHSSELSIYGTKGTIVSTPMVDKFSKGSLMLMTENQRSEFQYEESTHKQMLEAFAQGIDGSGPVPITGEDGVAVSQVIDSAYKSAIEGKKIDII